MTGTVEVYSKPACVQCSMSKKKLAENGIDYTEINMASDPAALDMVKSLGFMAAPVVIVRDAAGAVKNAWSGFNLENIKALATA